MWNAGAVSIEIVAVLDLLDGAVVRAVAGRRREYQPIHGLFGSGTDPAGLLSRMTSIFSLAGIYIADLNGILGRMPQFDVLAAMFRAGVRCWADIGACDLAGLSAADMPLGSAPILATETFKDLSSCLNSETTGELIFSLDLCNGAPVVADKRWQGYSAPQLAQELIRGGVKKLLCLDIAAVGMGQGVPTLPLCRQLKQEFPDLFLITGGGVRSPDCLLQARDAGVDALLVASALHDGRITPEDISRVTGGKG